MAERVDRADEASDEMNDAEIDEALIESFPASDPPPWTLGLDPHPKHEDETDEGTGVAQSPGSGE